MLKSVAFHPRCHGVLIVLSSISAGRAVKYVMSHVHLISFIHSTLYVTRSKATLFMLLSLAQLLHTCTCMHVSSCEFECVHT